MSYGVGKPQKRLHIQCEVALVLICIWVDKPHNVEKEEILLTRDSFLKKNVIIQLLFLPKYSECFSWTSFPDNNLHLKIYKPCVSFKD